eukprot:6829385-Ditylum_brightwellii.AAC.1
MQDGGCDVDREANPGSNDVVYPNVYLQADQKETEKMAAYLRVHVEYLEEFSLCICYKSSTDYMRLGLAKCEEIS